MLVLASKYTLHLSFFCADEGSPEVTPQQNGKLSGKPSTTSRLGNRALHHDSGTRRSSGSAVKTGEPSTTSRSHITLSRSSAHPKSANNRIHSAESDDDSDSEDRGGLLGRSQANLSAVRSTPSPIQRDFLKRHGGSKASSSSQVRSEVRAGTNGLLGVSETPSSHYKVTELPRISILTGIVLLFFA